MHRNVVNSLTAHRVPDSILGKSMPALSIYTLLIVTLLSRSSTLTFLLVATNSVRHTFNSKLKHIFRIISISIYVRVARHDSLGIVATIGAKVNNCVIHPLRSTCLPIPIHKCICTLQTYDLRVYDTYGTDERTMMTRYAQSVYLYLYFTYVSMYIEFMTFIHRRTIFFRQFLLRTVI